MPIDNGVSLPIFQPDQFTYVPWQPAANVTTFQLHYQSLAFLPPLSFDNKTLCDLNALYSQLDGELTTKLHDVCKNIAMLEPVTASTLTDVFTYLAFSLTFLHTLIFIILLFLPALFFTLKYRCHYFHRISWHSLTTTAEMLSQHRWRHLSKPISFSLLYYSWHLSLHHAYIYTTWISIRFILSFSQSHSRFQVPVTFTSSLPPRLKHGRFRICCWNGRFPTWGQPILHRANFFRSCLFWTSGKFYLRERFPPWT